MNEAIMKVLKERYFLRGETTWDQLATRVGGIYEPAMRLIKDMKFIPSTPTLMNGNTKGQRKGGLSSCFPMGIEDSISGIFDSLKDAAMVTKSAGGIGYNFSKLRSSKEIVGSLDGRTSTGPLPFIDMFNSMLDGIRQGGARRGAGMAMLDVDHPDILDFIDSKKDWETQRFSRFNISVRMTDSFYENLDNNPDAPMIVRNVVDRKDGELKDHNGKVVSYKQLWNKIIFYAHACAEPGIFNCDTAYKQCTVTNYSQDVLANPCSEFSNIANSSCNLGSLNLTKYVKNGEFDFIEFGNDVGIATRFLDSIIDINEFPTEKIHETTHAIRPIGLGIMGLAHAMILMKMPYASKEAKDFTKKLIGYITMRSMQESVELAKEKESYTAFDYETFIKANARFFNGVELPMNGVNLYGIHDVDIFKLKDDVKKFGVRNSCFTSIAPTGTISFIADVSGGIEPIFALAYARKIEKEKDRDGNLVYDIAYIADRFFEDYLTQNYSNDKKEILEYTSNNKGSCQGCPLMSKEDLNLFKTAQDLKSTEHLDVLEAVARMTSLSVSKTINLPETATLKDVADVYIDAYKRGIIGVTVYRDKCRGGILVHEEDLTPTIKKAVAPNRPKTLEGHMHQFVVNKQSYYVATGMMGKDLYEVFTGINHDDDGEVYIPKSVIKGKVIKNGKGDYDFKDETTQTVYHLTNGHSNAEADALTRSISTSLRHGVDISTLVQQLEKTKGALNSFAKAITRTLKHYIIDGVKIKGEACASCGAELIRIEGCKKCSNPECGTSICG